VSAARASSLVSERLSRTSLLQRRSFRRVPSFSDDEHRWGKPVGVRVICRILLAIVTIGPIVACRSSCNETSRTATPQASESVSSMTAMRPLPATPTASANPIFSPMTLLTLDRTAYHTKLDLAGDAIYLLTLEGAFRLVQGQAPQEMKLDLGGSAVATPSAIIFWSKGFLWLAPKQGGPPGRLASVKNQPMFIVAVEERFAWIGPDEQGHHAIFVLRYGKPHAVYVASGMVAAATMVEDRVVFLERPETDSWRLGSVPRDGGPPTFTETRNGRYPAMLVASAREVYYYFFDDKDTSEVRAVSSDLQTERVVASHFICSPFAVADRIFCGHVEGLFEITPDSGSPKLVYPNIASSITAIAADRNRVVWVSDIGPDKLAVKMLFREAIPSR